MCLSVCVCAISEPGMSQDIVNPDDQHCDPVLHVLHAQGAFSDLNHLCAGETRPSVMCGLNAAIYHYSLFKMR